MEFTFWYTLVLIVVMTIALIREIAGPDVIVFGTLLLCAIGGVVTIEDAFHGFANQGMLTVALLFVVAAALQSTGVTQLFIPWIFGSKIRSESAQVLRMMAPVSLFSAFTNNTSIVAVMIPVVKLWSRNSGRSASKYLLPLSYAAIAGGMCTLIGTSTNLVVHGMLLDAGLEGFEFFELAWVGIPVALVALLWTAIAAPRMLPRRTESMVELGENVREFVVEMKVDASYEHVGKTIQEAGLRHLRGLFLFQIERKGTVVTPVTPNEVVNEGDRLFFTGIPATILELQKTPGLIVVQDSTFDLKDYDSSKVRPCEVVISESSPLTGKSVRDSDFRSRYDAVILAIHRNGERINKKVGDIVLHSGDTLLILAESSFQEMWYNSKDFFLVTNTVTQPSKPKAKGFLALAIFLGFVVVATTTTLPLVLVAASAAILMVLTKCVTPAEGKVAVDWSVVVVIACAFGIGSAVEAAGIAAALADGVVYLLGSTGVLAVMFALYYLTNFYTEVITNNAAAALLFPVALSLSAEMNIPMEALAVIIAIAASASFATPIGYQTNLMVYGPGGYKFKEYIKMGLPLNVLSGIITVSIVYYLFIP